MHYCFGSELFTASSLVARRISLNFLDYVGVLKNVFYAKISRAQCFPWSHVILLTGHSLCFVLLR